MTTLATPEVCLRPEHAGDADAVRHVNVMAFERAAEADMVDSLRAAGAVALSAVALLGAKVPDRADLTPSAQAALWTSEVYGGEVVGHLLFTSASVSAGRGEMPLLGLASVAVLPANQRQGIGTLMVSGCLEYLRARGHRGVVVVGDASYYRRFGFIQADRWGLQNDLGIPDEKFLALSLTPGVLGGVSGPVRFRPEFAALFSAD